MFVCRCVLAIAAVTGLLSAQVSAAPIMGLSSTGVGPYSNLPADDPAFDGASGLQVIDFENFATSTQIIRHQIGDLTETLGNVTFSSTNGGGFNTGNADVRSYGVWGKSYRNTIQGPNYDIADFIRLDFAAPVDLFAMNIASIGNSWTLSAYDSGGLLLESMGLNAGLGASYNYFGFANSGISYVTLQSVGLDEILIDNVITATVPAPGAVLLLGFGLMGLVARRRSF